MGPTKPAAGVMATRPTTMPVAAHGVGGTVGALLTGVFASRAWNGTADGLLFGNAGQLGVQAVAALVAIAYSALGTVAILKAVALFAPLRVSAREEGLGLDVSQHGEEAYARGEGAILVLPDPAPSRPAGAGALEATEGGRA